MRAAKTLETLSQPWKSDFERVTWVKKTNTSENTTWLRGAKANVSTNY